MHDVHRSVRIVCWPANCVGGEKLLVYNMRIVGEMHLLFPSFCFVFSTIESLQGVGELTDKLKFHLNGGIFRQRFQYVNDERHVGVPVFGVHRQWFAAAAGGRFLEQQNCGFEYCNVIYVQNDRRWKFVFIIIGCGAVQQDVDNNVTVTVSLQDVRFN